MGQRTRARGREVRIDELLPGFDENGRRISAVRSWQGDVQSRLTAAETARQVRACIDMLPDGYREVLMLRDIEETDTEQTALQLGVSPGAVKTRLHRARQALRTLLEPFIQGEEAAGLGAASVLSPLLPSSSIPPSGSPGTSGRRFS